MSNFSFSLTPKGTGVVLKMTGELFRTESEAFEPQIDRVFEQSPDQLTVDMSELKAISSAGLGALLKLQTRAEQRFCKMQLAAVPKSIEGVIRNARLDSIFTLV